MSVTEPLCLLMGVGRSIFSKEEIFLLEAELFSRICEQLKKIFKIQYNNYFQVMKFNIEMEDIMMEELYVRCVINDILSTEEYSLLGIAYYTHKPEDVILDVATGKNTDPSSSLFRKIVELHRSVRPELYREIMKKILIETQKGK